MSGLRALNGRKEAKQIQQPAPVFFTPEQERKMTVGYQYEPDGKNVPALDEAILALKRAGETLTELSQTKERLKIVLEARETELAHTQAQLRECVNELCRMCKDDQYPQNGTCKTCQWQSVKEWDA